MNLQIKAWPGFRFSLNLAGIDEFSHQTTANARFYFTPTQDLQVKTLQVVYTCIFNYVYTTMPLLLFFQDKVTVRFTPEIVVVGTDPTTGLLKQQFTVFYSIANSLGAEINLADRPLGTVSIQVPFQTVPVR